MIYMGNGSVGTAFSELHRDIFTWMYLAGSGHALIPHPDEGITAAQGIDG